MVLGDVLKTNNTLKLLSIADSNFTDDSGLQSIINLLKPNNTLKYLDLINNNITDLETDDLISQLGDVERYKREGSHGFAQVKNMKIFLYKLEYKYWKLFYGKMEVDLREKNLTDEDGLAIGELLETNNTLTSLDLRNNNITDVQSIGEGLKSNNTLTSLDLHSNNITNVQSIGEGLKTNKTLLYLDLDDNNITDDSGIQSIIDGLKTNNTLRWLYLRSNQLSDNMKSQLKAIEQYKRDGSNGYQQVEGMEIDAMKSAAYIKWGKEFDGKTRVNLDGKNLTDEDALAIGELLKTNNTLEWLDLGVNNIIDVQSIGEGLKTNNTLEVLGLYKNNITDDSGIQSIIDVLKTNNTLSFLNLEANQLSDNMRSQLRAIQQYKIDGSNGYQQVEGMEIIA